MHEKEMKELDMNNSIEIDTFESKDLNHIREETETKIFMNQLGALFLKQYRYFSRDFISLLCQILIPLILILISFGLTKIKYVQNVPTITFDPSIYKDYIYLNKDSD